MSSNQKQRRIPEVKQKVKDNLPAADNANDSAPKNYSNLTAAKKNATPIPIDFGGNTFKYSTDGKKYIPFIGSEDNLPQLFLEARLISPTHDGCVTRIAECTVGKGLTVVDIEEKDIPKEFTEWLDNVNNECESFDELLIGAADGERTQGNQFIEIVRGKVGPAKYVKVHLHSMLYCRLNEKGDAVIVSKAFAKRGYSSEAVTKGTQIPIYNPNRRDKSLNWIKGEIEGEQRTMIHLRNKVAGVDHYGLPQAKATLRDQVLEGKSVQYNLDLFNNGMVLSGVFVFKGAMTRDEARENARAILDAHTGDENQGKIGFVSSENGIEDFDLKQFQTQKEGSYDNLQSKCREKIISANGWAAEFLGGDSGAGLSKGGDYLRSKWDTVETQTLKPLRKKLISKVVKPIVNIWADWMEKPEVKEYKFDFPSDMPFSFLGELKPEDIMLINEGRKLAGLPERPDGDVYISHKKKESNVQGKPPSKEDDNND